MKKYIAGLFIALSFAAHNVHASIENPQAGVDYQLLPGAKPLPLNPVDKAASQKPQAGAAVEVKEFFWYGCPHCATLDTKLSTWLERNDKLVNFHKIPVAFSKDLEVHQKLYHALVAMEIPASKIAVLNAKIFEEIQVNKNYLLTPDAQAQFLSKYGVDSAQFLQAYSSDAVNAAVAEDAVLTDKYKIDGVPALIVEGQYMTSPATTGSLDGAIQVLDFLVNRIHSQL